MRSMRVILLYLILLFPGQLSAELYKYYDPKGALCFTDDFSMVPKDQRPKVETFHEIEKIPDVSENQKTEGESNSMKIIEPDLSSENEQELKVLEEIRKQLDDEYIQLKEQQDLLITEAQGKMNSEETKAYNQRANTLNQEALKYKEKQQAYFQRVEAYNLKLRSVQ